MICRRRLLIPAALAALLGGILPCDAQQVYTEVPLVNTRDSFYESIGTDWGFSHRGRNGYVFFRRGGANTGIPAFGGFDPNAVARFGFGSRGSNGSFYFNGWAGQGSSRSITSATPGLMLQNGTSGYFQDISVRPFVIGLTPVVGAGAVIPITGSPMPVGPAPVGPVPVSPVAERLERLRQEAALTSPNSQPTDAELLLGAGADPTFPKAGQASAGPAPSRSSAERGDISLEEIRRQQAARTQADPAAEINKLIETARLAEARGLKGAARIRYQQAAAKSTGELKQALLAKCQSLRE